MDMIAGPVVYGVEQIFCADCSGCNTKILECRGATTGANIDNGTLSVDESEGAHKSMHETTNNPHIGSLSS